MSFIGVPSGEVVIDSSLFEVLEGAFDGFFGFWAQRDGFSDFDDGVAAVRD